MDRPPSLLAGEIKNMSAEATVARLMELLDSAGAAAEDLRGIERYIATVEEDEWAQQQLAQKSATNYAAREALHAALRELLDLGEPVAWISDRDQLQLRMGDKPGAHWRPLYAAPKAKP